MQGDDVDDDFLVAARTASVRVHCLVRCSERYIKSSHYRYEHRVGARHLVRPDHSWAERPTAATIMTLLLLPAALLAHRYQLCNFTCADTNETWLACRSEKCTPRLPEDFCVDGNEAALYGADGEKATDEAGVRVSGPQECAEVWEAPLPGSFAERCDLCMELASELTMLWHAEEREKSAVAAGAPPVAVEEDAGLAVDDASRVCAEAAVRAEALLPTVRTCRYHAPACAAVLSAAKEHACPQLWALRRGGGTERAVRQAQRELCGALATQRNGSSVDDALVCPHPRDVGARIMGISAVVAGVVLALQMRLGVYASGPV